MDINEHFAGAGHNAPPDSLDALQARVDELVSTANRWATERPVITDTDMAEKCATFIGQVQAELKAIEKSRKAEKAPHTEAGKAVDTKYQPMLAVLKKCKDVLNPLRTAWLQRIERERERAANQARAEAEAKSRAADVTLHAYEEAKRARLGDVVGTAIAVDAAIEESDAANKEAERIATSRARIESPHGQRATSLRTYWHARLTDVDQALCHYADRPELAEQLTKFANADARAGARDIPGFEVYSTETAA